MIIQKPAMAGTLESSDAQVTVEPGTNGIELVLKSSVMNQYGRQIKATILETLERLDIDNVRLTIVDKGALDCTIKARVECAVFRSCGVSAANIPWGGAIRGIQAVDPDNDLGSAVVNGGQGVVQREPSGILLILGHGIFQVQHDGVASVDVGILDKAGLLGVHEHHGSAQAEPFGLGSSDHRTAPPQGIFSADAPQERNTAHSTRAFRVQSNAPLSTTVTRAFCTSKRSSVDRTVALI